MKCVYVVALFAFVALQMSQAAPVPEEEKKVEAAAPEVAVQPVVPAVAAVAEVASETPASAAPVVVSSEPTTLVAVEEKKA